MITVIVNIVSISHFYVQHNRCSPLLIVFLIIVSATLSCIVPSDEGLQDITMTLADTTNNSIRSPYQKIRIVFSETLDTSSSVFLRFNPLWESYHLISNVNRDTFTIIPAFPLDGNTNYIITLAESVTAQNRIILSPGRDSIFFYTYPREWEPNQDTSTADILDSCIFGSIQTVNDSDWYVISEPIHRIILQSSYSPTAFLVYDHDAITYQTHDESPTDTLEIPETIHYPLYLIAISRDKLSGGYYQITIN